MVSGFLGTLISLERVVALSQTWAYAAPLAGTIGTLLLIFNVSAGGYFLILSSLGLVLVFVPVLRRQYAVYTVTMAAGALTWLSGNIIWQTSGVVYQAVPWWAAFLVLTIAGERLEISRVLRLNSLRKSLFAFIVAAVIIGLVTTLFFHSAGVRLTGLGFVALALWLGAYDIARRTVQKEGLTRYLALNLLVGYGWLAVGGLLAVTYGEQAAGFYYDAWIHAVFLGFVFSMIFAHALIILPAVTGISIPYHPILFGPVLLMHLGLILRLVSDLLLWQNGRRWGGLLNGLSLLWFLLILVRMAIVTGRKQNV
jgi:hypothetical protein